VFLKKSVDIEQKGCRMHPIKTTDQWVKETKMASKNFKDYQQELIELEDNEEQITNSLVSDSELLELDEIDIKKFCLELDTTININELDNFQWEYNQ
jgi:hypothetical protein